MVTITHNGRPFSWSYSRLKNFETCPKKHWHVDIQKDVKEAESEQLKWGDVLHKAAAKRLSKKVALPPGMENVEAWCQRIEATPGKILVEQKLAMTKDFGPCDFFDKKVAVWFRSIADVIKIMGPVALLLDWKTGKILEDSQQLALGAACVFAHYPEVQRVRSIFAWLKEGPDVETQADFTRAGMVDMWKNIWPRIQQLQHAHDTTNYPAQPGRLCRNWCPVTQCPHHGESF